MTEKLRAGLADLATQAMPTDLRGRVHSGVRRRVQRNRALAALAAAVVTAGFVAGYATFRPIGAGPEPANSTSPSPSVTTPAVDLYNATFWVPTYPGPWGTPCFGGSRKFVDGIADVAEEAKLHMVGVPVRGDADGQPGDEVVVTLVCSTEGGSDPNPLLVRVEGDASITTLGWVNLDADGELLVLDRAEPIVFAGGGVSVSVLGRYGDVQRDLDKQSRVFAYRDGRVRQVGGPTTFAPGTTDVRAVDLRNSTLYIATDGSSGLPGSYLGYVKTAGGTGTATFEKIVNSQVVGHVPVQVVVRQTQIVRTGDRETAVALIDLTPADGPMETVVMAYHYDETTGYAVHDPWTVAMPNPGEHFDTLAVSDNQIRVDLSTIEGGGARTFEFNPGPTGPRWVEL